MKNIDHDELFRNVSQFLQGKGVELKEGSYTRRLQQCCGLLADVVNTTNKTVARACAEVDKKLKDIRETLKRRKEKGATPPSPPPAPASASAPEPPARPQAKAGAKASAARVRAATVRRSPAKRKTARK